MKPLLYKGKNVFKLTVGFFLGFKCKQGDCTTEPHRRRWICMSLLYGLWQLAFSSSKIDHGLNFLFVRVYIYFFAFLCDAD